VVTSRRGLPHLQAPRAESRLHGLDPNPYEQPVEKASVAHSGEAKMLLAGSRPHISAPSTPSMTIAGKLTVPTQKYLPAEISRPTHHFIHHHTFYYYKIKINGLFVRPVTKYSQIAGLKAEILLN